MKADHAPGGLDNIACPMTRHQPVPNGKSGATLATVDAAHPRILPWQAR
jgi:hypothetical protein